MFCLFTIKFHFYFFAYFRFKFFASNFSLCFTLVIFASKRIKSEAKFRYIFSLFFALNFSLRFDLVIFASKRNEGENFFVSKEAKYNIFRIISLPNFVLVKKKKHFYQYFRFALIFSLNFRLFLPSFLLQICGVSHRSESCEIRLFFASKRNEIFASISNFASEAKVREHPR